MMNCFCLNLTSGIRRESLVLFFQKKKENKILGRERYLEPMMTGARYYHDHIRGNEME